METTTNKLWECRCFGWHMIVAAPTKREAQRIANANVDSFGGIVGVDRATVTSASEDDVASYRAMGGF